MVQGRVTILFAMLPLMLDSLPCRLPGFYRAAVSIARHFLGAGGTLEADPMAKKRASG